MQKMVKTIPVLVLSKKLHVPVAQFEGDSLEEMFSQYRVFFFQKIW